MRHILLITCSLYEVTLGQTTMTGKVSIDSTNAVDLALSEIYSLYLEVPQWIECDISDKSCKSDINKLLEDVRKDIVDNRIKKVHTDIQIDEYNYFQVYVEWVEMFSGESDE